MSQPFLLCIYRSTTPANCLHMCPHPCSSLSCLSGVDTTSRWCPLPTQVHREASVSHMAFPGPRWQSIPSLLCGVGLPKSQSLFGILWGAEEETGDPWGLSFQKCWLFQGLSYFAEPPGRKPPPCKPAEGHSRPSDALSSEGPVVADGASHPSQLCFPHPFLPRKS